MTEFKGPIVEGSWYELIENDMAGMARLGAAGTFVICGFRYFADATPWLGSSSPNIRPIHVNPAQPEQAKAAHLQALRSIRVTHSEVADNGRTASVRVSVSGAAELIDEVEIGKRRYRIVEKP